MSHFEFLTWNENVVVRVHGLANMNNSHLFKDLIDSLLGLGSRLFVIDLEHCTGMDSTFMGNLVGITLYEPEDPPEPQSAAPRAMLVNVGEHCRAQLENLGLQNLIQVRGQALDLPPGAAFERIEERRYDPRQRVRMIEEAHRNLVRVNERNAALFGPILATLAAELRNCG